MIFYKDNQQDNDHTQNIVKNKIHTMFFCKIFRSVKCISMEEWPDLSKVI